MPIRCKAESDGRGVMLSHIENRAHAERIRDFFAELGVSATILESHGSEDRRVYLDRISLEIFDKFSRGAPAGAAS